MTFKRGSCKSKKIMEDDEKNWLLKNDKVKLVLLHRFLHNENYIQFTRHYWYQISPEKKNYFGSMSWNVDKCESRDLKLEIQRRDSSF